MRLTEEGQALFEDPTDGRMAGESMPVSPCRRALFRERLRSEVPPHHGQGRQKARDQPFHDIRAKTGTDARDAGLDSQALLGHTTEAQHQTYLRSRAPVHVQPVKRL